jgi:hypothetical protein
MDPIRTAVKYSLIPLRTLVQLGEIFVESGREAPQPPEAPDPAPARPKPRAAQKRTQPRRKPVSTQATQTPKDLDDVAIARKVETVIFRDDAVEKGKIDVNAADGVVWLRGEAKTPEQIKDLERQAAAIPEVKKVENLLHLPKTPAPTRSDTPPSQRKTRRTASRSAGSQQRRVQTRQTNERRSAVGEDLPVETAHEGEGRRPAPLGSNGSGS